ncbi:MAG TPA: hypothetical protein PK993_00260 [Clostridia bacterium]|nr:hypothetical protein [Clostridia bacterium]
MERLIPEFKESLFGNFKDTAEDYIELGIDSVLEEGLLSEVPIVKTLFSTFKFAKNIYDRNLLKNLVIFIKELNSGSIDSDKKDKYKEKLDSNQKFAEKELGRILIILNNYIDNEKTVFLARLFRAYIIQQIIWEEFCEYSEVINRLFIQDVKILIEIASAKFKDTSNREDLFRIERLNSLGIIALSIKGISVSSLSGARQDSYVTINKFGNKLIKIILV